ncbi:carbamoyltransferase [Nitrospira moscoviensis]|uniref:Carbamoyltransferase n=1 Tax=Nitrospira moscoviensis TaxID=42253 RepID=A0A0K2GCS6_NITMO|nr:carbamoyltransferase C-terminal domain-containing protein [Nitrospira moscoviensis]ALA58760.1 hypothetical protein NITMOv2_2345 [Nitrospira moscoviensis]
MYTLGINAAFHDPAACLVKDGVVLAAAEEERFTRIKHGKRPIPFSAYELPFHAIDYCLKAGGIELRQVDHVAYSFDPFITLGGRRDATVTLPLEPSAQPPSGEWESPWEPLFLSYIVNAPRHLADGVPHHLRARFRGATPEGPYRWHFVPHHLAHAASAFLPSPFSRAAVMTLDGRGERATTSYWSGAGHRVAPLGTVDMPHSLGLLYEQLTRHLGFLHSSDEYKVMALASYGKPVYLDEFHDVVRYEGEGRYRIQPVEWEERFGAPRVPGGPIEQRHYDLARSLQVVLEYTVLRLAQWLHETTKLPDLCLAGGVALNCVMNARLRDLSPFANMWVQPAAGDAGTALGAALWIDGRMRDFPEARSYVMEDVLLGPSYDDETIDAFLRRAKLRYRRLSDVAEETAALLADGLIVGWFQDRMEWGPRALGARSILASPLTPDMQERMNGLKDREDFRPVAPVVPEESAGDWFVKGGRSPFMLFVFDVLPDRAHRIPAVRHVDGTARVQTVTRDRQPRYYDLLRAFERRTGVPVLINTSFNTRSEPIVCTPRDAVEAFYTAPLDALVIGSFLLEKGR